MDTENADNGIYTYIMRFGNIEKFNNYLRFTALFGIILRVVVSKKLREVR